MIEQIKQKDQRKMHNSTSNAYREMAAALRAGSGFNAIYLNFTRGAWSAGKDKVDMTTREVVAHVNDSAFGHVKWENKQMVDFDLGFVRDRFRPKLRSTLGDTDPRSWPGGKDPWVFNFLLPVSDPKTAQLYLYSTSSKGGRDALANLQDAYADHQELHPAQADKLPMICLSSSWYPHPEFGRVTTPCLDIIGWVDPPADVKPLRLPTSSASALIESRAVKQIEPPKSIGGEMDDEIPF
jgi:hypothetical protein